MVMANAIATEHPAEIAHSNTQESGPGIEGASAHWISSDRLIWNTFPEATEYRLYYSGDAGIQVFEASVAGGDFIPIAPVNLITPVNPITPDTTLSDSLADKFRHISDRPVFSMDTDTETIRTALRGQLVAVALDEEGKPLAATRVQPHGVIDEIYQYDGALGAVWREDGVTLSVWAPTAQEVTITLYDPAEEAEGTVESEGKEEAEGTEEAEGKEETPPAYASIATIDPAEFQPANGVWRFEGGRA